MKPVIIIVFALAVVQGFAVVDDDLFHCRDGLRDTFDKLGLDFQLGLKLSYIDVNCTANIKEAIDSVQSQIDKSTANDTKCLKKLSDKLDKINTTYEEHIITYTKTLVDNEIGKRFVNFLASLINCVENAPKCEDIPSCSEDLKNAFFMDDAVTIGEANRFIKKFVSGISKECKMLVIDVREIRGNITLCS